MFSAWGDGQKRSCFWQLMASCTSSIGRTGSQDKQLFDQVRFCLCCIIMRAMRFHRILLLVVHGVCVLSHVWFFATHGLYPARLPCLWNFLGKNTGVGYHFLLQGNLSNPGTEPTSLVSPALAGRFFTTWATWEAPLPLYNCAIVDNKIYGDFPGSPVVRTLRFQ